MAEQEFTFDKFMEKIIEIEDKTKERKVDVTIDTPARIYQKRYREDHNYHIVYRKGT